VVQAPAFQRLRRIKQQGFSDFVYPGATHSRFAHSVGVFHTARQLMRIIRHHLTESRYVATHAQAALAAALVHDLGHGPFSHAFEDVGKRLNISMAAHENVSDAIIRDSEVAEALKTLGSGFANDVADIVKSKTPKNIYAAVVSSQFDADRLDYIRRDRLMTGTRLARIDFEWLLANLEVSSVPFGVDEQHVGTLETFVLGPKAIYAAEAYVLGLFQLYPSVYFHKTTRAAEKLFSELLVRLIRLVKDGSVRRVGLPAKHPLMRFAKDPENLNNVLSLDDTVVWGALPSLTTSSDALISQFSSRLLRRELPKAIDVRAEVLKYLDVFSTPKSLKQARKHGIDIQVDRICNSIYDRVEKRKPSKGLPKLLADRGERSPYRLLEESRGPLNQILIKQGDELLDIVRVSTTIRAVETFKFFRIYVEKDDSITTKAVFRIIEEEAKNGKKG